MSANNQKKGKVLIGIAAALLAVTYGAVLQGILKNEVFRHRFPEEKKKDADVKKGTKK